MFKQKYSSVLAEYEKFWERKNTEHPILNISYQKPGAEAYRKPESLEEQWLDPEYNYNAFKIRSENYEYLAEGIPGYFANLGLGCLYACLGGTASTSEVGDAIIEILK